MPRSLRIQYPGAKYHVINRGNYKRDVFAEAGSAQAFVAALEEAVDRYGWRLAAYVVMRNHYHLALHTPEPNLAAGMHWLQSTFATRFNRMRKENGHLFQGRYKALLLERGMDLARVVDYIHLNPFRAGLVKADQLAHFRWSSLNRFYKNQRFNGLSSLEWMQAIGLEDSAEGWTSYASRLLRRAKIPPEVAQLEHKKMTTGWALGSSEWKESTLAHHLPDKLREGERGRVGWSSDLLEAKWKFQLKQELADEGKSPTDLESDRKSAPWKIAVAERLQRELGVPIKWIARELNMGNERSVRVYLWRHRKINN